MKEIQKNILAIAILYPDDRFLIFGDLKEHHFNNEFRTVFKEMKKLYNSNKEIDPLVIVNDIGQEYFETIESLSNIKNIKRNTKQYIDILIDSYKRNQAKYQLSELLVNVSNKEYSISDLQDECLKVSKIFQSNNSKFRCYSMKEGLTEVLNNLNSIIEYYKTGFKYLDRLVNIEKADFIIIGGRPSSGKTTFATNLMANMAMNNNVVFFSLETSAKGIYQKIISSQAKINMAKILNNKLQDNDYVDFVKKANELSVCTLDVVEAAGMNLNDIKTTAMQKKANIIFIDYLQLINERGDDSYEIVTKISKELHSFAQKEKICVVALSQLRRPTNGAKRPSIIDLRESGQLEQDADSVILIHNAKPTNDLSQQEKQTREVIIAKNKKGFLSILNFEFDGVTQTFSEVEG